MPLNKKIRCYECCTYRTVPMTARLPAYGAKTFQVNDRDSNNMEAPLKGEEKEKSEHSEQSYVQKTSTDKWQAKSLK